MSENNDIPLVQLVVANEHRRECPELGRAFHAFSVLDTASRRFYTLMVDVKDQAVVDVATYSNRADVCNGVGR